MGDCWEKFLKPNLCISVKTENHKKGKNKKHVKPEKTGLHVKTNKTGILTGETLRLFLSRDDSIKII